MIVKAILDEDFNDYKKPSLFIAFPVCTLKCDRLNNCKVCQNSTLLKEPDIPVDISKLVKHYLKNNLTEAIVSVRVSVSVSVSASVFSLRSQPSS